MTISVTHSYVAVGTDAGNGEVHKAEWNAGHTLNMASGKILGRATTGTGSAEELSYSDISNDPFERLVLTPSISYNFTSSDAALSGTATVSANGTYFPVSNNLKVATSNIIRIDHKNGSARGFLCEEARTRLNFYPRDFTNAAWTKSNITTAKTATGIDGVTNSASTLTATAGNGTALQGLTSGSASRVTSMWVKRRTGSGNIQMTQDNGGTWTTVTVTSDWTKVVIPAATAANPTVGIRIVTNADAIDVDYFQHELGTAALSSIDGNDSGTQTRAADVLTISGTDFTDNWSAVEGTIIADFMLDGLNSSTSSVVFSINDNTNSNRVILRIASGVLFATVTIGGVAVADINLGAVVIATKYRVAFSVKADAIYAAVNGVAGTPDTSTGAALPVVNQWHIGHAVTANQLNGTLLNLGYSPKAISTDVQKASTL